MRNALDRRFCSLKYQYLIHSLRKQGSGLMSRDEMVIVEMKKHFQLRAIEWWSAGVMACWGIWVLLFPGMFEANPASQALLWYAPQHIWGLCATTAGCLRLVALFINGLWYRTPAIRWACSMVSILIWFLIAAAYTSADMMNVGTVIYGWHVVADMYSAFRSASDFIEAEAQRQLKRLAATNEGDGSNVSRISARQR